MGLTIANVAYYYVFMLVYLIALRFFFFAPVIVAYKVPALELNHKQNLRRLTYSFALATYIYILILIDLVHVVNFRTEKVNEMDVRFI